MLLVVSRMTSSGP